MAEQEKPTKRDLAMGLTQPQIERLLDGRVKVLLYYQIAKYKTIQSLLAPYGRTVILYPADVKKPLIGHWTAVYYTVDNRGRKIIEVFDPYGLGVDREFAMANQHFPHYLAALLRDASAAGTPVSYNDHQVQSASPSIGTCGRHVVVRLWLQHLPLEKYYKMVGRTGVDALVTRLTSPFLKNKRTSG